MIYVVLTEMSNPCSLFAVERIASDAVIAKHKKEGLWSAGMV